MYSDIPTSGISVLPVLAFVYKVLALF